MQEMVINFGRNNGVPDPVHIKEVEAERVDSYRYLGVIIDKKLNLQENSNAILKKAQPRMYCLRKLRSFNVKSYHFTNVLF